MGKIRVKTLGDEDLEQEQKNAAKKKHEAKKTVKAPGMKGGERVVAVGPSEEELEALEVKEETKVTEKTSSDQTLKGRKKEKFTKQKSASRSQRYQALVQQIDKVKLYTLNEALKLLEGVKKASFDETVEMHLNTVTPGISGNVTLPYGSGKQTRVAVANDQLIADIEKGIINFDVLVAQPAMMPNLAKVAKILGPKGLMPNPKNQTVTEKPEEVAKKYAGGQISFKTEANNPLMHLVVGKLSFGTAKLQENIEAMFSAIKKSNIKNATLKSTMSPGIKIKI
jgi:large subunit ribosomal protein L1